MGHTVERFSLSHDDEPTRIIRGRVERPAASAGEPLPWVLVLHGFKGFINWGFFPELTRRIAAAGLACVSFDNSGSGVGADGLEFSEHEAFARHTYTRELQDVERVRAHAASGALGALHNERVGLFGHSRGGGMALLHAARRRDYRALVTWAAIDNVDRFDDATKALWRRQGFIEIHNGRTGQDHRIDLTALDDMETQCEGLDILKAAAQLGCPTLVVHGTEDEAVEYEAGRRIVAALSGAPARLLTVEGAGHTFGAKHPAEPVQEPLEGVLAATVGHFVEHLGGD